MILFLKTSHKTYHKKWYFQIQYFYKMIGLEYNCFFLNIFFHENMILCIVNNAEKI